MKERKEKKTILNSQQSNILLRNIKELKLEMYTDARVVYTYHENDTITVEELNEKLVALHIPALVFVAVSMVIGTIGNLLVVIIYKRNYRRSNHRYFILFLASIDLLACTTGLPFLIASLRLPYMMTSAIACKVLRYLHYLTNNSSGLLLVVISVERYRKICRPFKVQWSPRQILYLCIATVLVSAIIAIPSPIFFGKSKIDTGIANITGYQCYIDEKYKGTNMMEAYNEVLMSESVVCIFLFIVLYIFIIRKVKQSDQFINAMRSMRSLKIKSYHRADVHDNSHSTDALDDGSGTSSGGKNNTSQRNSKTSQEDGQTLRKESSASTSMTTLCSIQPVNKELINEITEIEKNKNACSPQGLAGNGTMTLPATVNLSQLRNGEGRQTDDKTAKKSRSLPSTRRQVIDRLVFRSNASTTSEVSLKPGHSSKATIRVTVMLFTVSLVFAAAFLPHLALMVVTSRKKDFLNNLSATEVMLYQLFLRIFIINNIANPIIYLFCDKKFRQGCYELLYVSKCCRRSDR